MFFTKDKENDPKNIDEVLSTASFSTLEIDFNSLDFNIKAGNKFEVKYQGPKYKKPEIQIDHETMIIKEPDVRDKEIKRWEKGFFKIEINTEAKAKLAVVIPNNHVLDEIDLHLKSGDTHLDGITVNDFEMEEMSGNLLAKNIQFSNLSVCLNAGDIDLQEIRLDAGEISLSSGNFSIKKARIDHKFSVDTVSGDNLASQVKVDKCQLKAVNGINRILENERDEAQFGRGESLLEMTTVSGNNTVE